MRPSERRRPPRRCWTQAQRVPRAAYAICRPRCRESPNQSRGGFREHGKAPASLYLRSHLLLLLERRRVGQRAAAQPARLLEQRRDGPEVESGAGHVTPKWGR